MMLKGHLVVASSGFVIYVDTMQNGQWPPFSLLIVPFILTLFGAILPDIDHTESTIGKRLRFISVPLSMCLGHRGITHSLLACLLCYIALEKFDFPQLTWIALGYCLHLVGDYLTPSGIPLLYPYRKRYRFIVTGETGGISETILASLSVVLSVIVINY